MTSTTPVNDRNLTWHDHKITKAQRHQLNGHGSAVLWFTGLSGSGKSTLANAVEERLHKLGIRTYTLDGDNIRQGLNKDLGFSDEARAENIRRISEVAKLFVDAGCVVTTAFISPFRKERELCRSLVDAGEMIEIYVECPLDICESRDVKGLYKKARAGEIKQFTGIDSPYEAPENPELVIRTHEKDVDGCVDQIMDYLVSQKLIPAF